MEKPKEDNKKLVIKQNDSVKPKLLLDVFITLALFFLLFIFFLLQPENRQTLFSSKPSIDIVISLLKVFLLTWLLPFSTLVVALLTFRNIALTKESMRIAKEAIVVSQNTLDQMRLSDRKNTAPMLKFALSIGGVKFSPRIDDANRPREIILWNDKQDTKEHDLPHYLNLKLNNVQEHPHGVAIGVSLKLKLTFSKCESEKEITEETLDVSFSNMDAKEEYEESLIKISGMPNLTAQIESIKYRDMFGQQYVIGYGLGVVKMVKPYLGINYFLSLSGQSPDNP